RRGVRSPSAAPRRDLPYQPGARGAHTTGGHEPLPVLLPVQPVDDAGDARGPAVSRGPADWRSVGYLLAGHQCRCGELAGALNGSTSCNVLPILLKYQLTPDDPVRVS